MTRRREPSCPECAAPMHWGEPPDARPERWWCDRFPLCFGRLAPGDQVRMLR